MQRLFDRIVIHRSWIFCSFNIKYDLIVRTTRIIMFIEQVIDYFTWMKILSIVACHTYYAFTITSKSILLLESGHYCTQYSLLHKSVASEMKRIVILLKHILYKNMSHKCRPSIAIVCSQERKSTSQELLHRNSTMWFLKETRIINFKYIINRFKIH